MVIEGSPLLGSSGAVPVTLGLNLRGAAVNPLPETAALLGDPAALCVKTMFPDAALMDVGVNETVKVWFADGASVPLAGETVNWVLLELTDEMPRGAPPVLVTVSILDCVVPTPTFPKFKLPGDTENCGTAIAPVPLTDTELGEPGALWVKLMLPDADVAEAGVNVIENF